MGNLVRSEWIKFRSVRSNLFVLLAALGVIVLASVLGAHDASTNGTTTCQQAPAGSPAASGRQDPDSLAACGEGSVLVSSNAEVHLVDVTGGSVFAALMFAVLGVQVIGQEYRFSTIRPTFTAAPHRRRVMVAKLLLISAVAAVGSAVNVVVAAVLGRVVAGGLVIDGVDRRVAWGIVLFTVLWTVAGMGVGALARQPVAGIVIIAGEALILESLLQSLVHSSAPWVPFYNGLQMVQSPVTDSDLRSTFAGGVYFAAVCIAVWLAGTVMVARRDA